MADSTSPAVLDIEGPEGAGPEPTTVAGSREWVRRFLAVSLVVIFGIEVLGAMLSVWFSTQHLQELKDILTLILSPTVALAGSATGFYFGRSATES
jgi:hypothetical protein